jgi:DNA (cytosine-5)-methyltransferase 1
MGFDATWGVISAADTGAPHLRERIWIVAYDNSSRELQSTWDEHLKRNGIGQCSEILANSSGRRCEEPKEWEDQFSRRVEIISTGKKMADAVREREQRIFAEITNSQDRSKSSERQAGSCCYGYRQWPAEPDVGRVANGVAFRVDKIKAIGNGQVPRVAATAWKILSQ